MRVMQSASFAIRKSAFFLLNGALVLLSALVFFLYRDKRLVQQQNRKLIIQNDSIMSVNIMLADSVKQRPLPALIQEASLTKARKEK